MSTNEKIYVEKVLNSYKEKETSKIDELKALDNKVKKAPKVFAYIFGSISSLILGFGMSVAMGVILKDLMWLGIVVGVIGLFLVIINYFLYKAILKSRKTKYAKQITDLSNEILN